MEHVSNTGPKKGAKGACIASLVCARRYSSLDRHFQRSPRSLALTAGHMSGHAAEHKSLTPSLTTQRNTTRHDALLKRTLTPFFASIITVTVCGICVRSSTAWISSNRWSILTVRYPASVRAYCSVANVSSHAYIDLLQSKHSTYVLDRSLVHPRKAEISNLASFPPTSQA
jgi:hypothetical protein